MSTPKRGSGESKKPQQPGIPLRSMPLDEDSLDSWGEDSDDEESAELDVTVDEEDVDYEKHVVLGRLSRNTHRDTIWQSKLDAYFVISQFLVSPGLTFIVHLEKFGFRFLPAYIATTLFVGFPLVYLEIALGQFTSCNVYTIFRRIAPAAAGIGIAALMANGLSMLTSFIRIVTFLQIFVDATNPFTNTFPWTTCHAAGDTKYCTARVADCEDLILSRGDRRLPQQYDYMGKELGIKYARIGDTCVRTDDPIIQRQLEPPKDLFPFDPMVQHLFPNLDVDDLTFKFFPSELRVMLTVIAWLVIIALAHRKRQIMVKLARISTLLVVTVIVTTTAILFKVRHDQISLSNIVHDNGQQDYFEPLLWMEAVLLTIRTLKIGQGGLPYLASQNEFRNNIFWDSAILVMCAVVMPFCLSLWALLIIDSYRLSLAYGNYSMFSKVRELRDTKNAGLVVIALLATSMQVLEMFGPFCLLLLSSFVIISIITNCLIRVDIIVTTIIEIEESFRDPTTRGVLVNEVVIVAAFFGMAFYSSIGFKLLLGFDEITIPMLSAFVILAEIMVLGLVYGIRRFFANVTAMNRSKAQNDFLQNWIIVIMTFNWMVVAPGFIVFTIGCCLHQALYTDGNDKSKYFLATAVLLACVIPALFIAKWADSKAKGRDWTQLFAADPDLWGPRSAVYRELNDRLERKIKPFQMNFHWAAVILGYFARKKKN